MLVTSETLSELKYELRNINIEIIAATISDIIIRL